MPVEFVRRNSCIDIREQIVCDSTKLLMAYDGSGRRVTKTRMRKAEGGGDWETELVTHYTGIGTEVHENYRNNALEKTKVVVNMPQGLGRYGVSDVILSDSEESSNTQPNEFYLKNHLGSTMLVYGTGDGAGSVKAAYDYRATVVAMRTKQQVAKCCPPFGEQVDLEQKGDKVTENFTGIRNAMTKPS